LKNIADLEKDTNVDLKNIAVKTKLGGTINDIELFKGIIFPHKSVKIPGGSEVKTPKVALLQFCLSSPKTNMDNNIVVKDYNQIDKILK